MKKNGILIICLCVLLAVCAVASVVIVDRGAAEKTGASDELAAKLNAVFDSVNDRLSNVKKTSDVTPSPAPSSSDDIQLKIGLLHLYAQSDTIVSILPFTTVQVTEAALLKAFMSSSTAVNEALVYIDRYADRTLASAYETMDELLQKYGGLLTKYNISSSSAYTSKYNRLSSMFSSLKNSSTELLSRTRTLIKMSKSDDYDAYYTNYVEQLSDLTGKIEQYCTAINNEYNALLSDLSDDYEDIK